MSEPMAQLTITFKYFSAFVNHAGGTTVFLPSTGHHAKIEGPGITGALPLTGTDVSIRSTTGASVTSGSRAPAGGGYLTALTCALPNATTTFGMARLTESLDVKKMNARFSLPWGALEDRPMQKQDFQDSVWDFGNGCKSKATDIGIYTYDFPDGTCELLIGTTAYPLGTGDAYVVTNGDLGADPAECAPGIFSDPSLLGEFPDLVASLGLTAPAVPAAPLPEGLKLLLGMATTLGTAVKNKRILATPESVETLVAAAMMLRICKPCPSLQLDL